jgi:hypothetical protein
MELRASQFHASFHIPRQEREANAFESAWSGIASNGETMSAAKADIANDAKEIRSECKLVAEALLAIFAAKEGRCAAAVARCVGAPSIRLLAVEISKCPLTRLRASLLFATVASEESISVMERHAEWATLRAEWEGISGEWRKNRLRVDEAMAQANASHEEAKALCLGQLASPYANLAAMAALWRKLPAGATRKSTCSETKQQTLVAAHAAENLRGLLEIASEGGSVYEEPK